MATKRRKMMEAFRRNAEIAGISMIIIIHGASIVSLRVQRKIFQCFPIFGRLVLSGGTEGEIFVVETMKISLGSPSRLAFPALGHRPDYFLSRYRARWHGNAIFTVRSSEDSCFVSRDRERNFLTRDCVNRFINSWRHRIGRNEQLVRTWKSFDRGIFKLSRLFFFSFSFILLKSKLNLVPNGYTSRGIFEVSGQLLFPRYTRGIEGAIQRMCFDVRTFTLVG